MGAKIPGEASVRNSKTMVRMLLVEGPLPRSSIAQRLGVSIPTVMDLVTTLKSFGVVTIGVATYHRGRPAPPIQVANDAWYSVGADIGGTKVAVGLFNSHLELVEDERWPTPRDWDELLNRLASSVHRLSDKARGRPLGVGIGVPSIVEHGVLVDAPNLGVRDIAVLNVLKERWAYPTVVENDVNLAALAEYDMALRRHEPVHSLVLCALGTGIGCGIVLNGKLWSGSQGAAGEVAYLLPSLDMAPCTPPANGCLEPMAAASSLGTHWAVGVDPNRLLKLAEAGDERALEAFQRWGTAVGHAALAVVAILNPEVLLIGGAGSRSARFLFPVLEDILHRHAPYPPPVRAPVYGELAALYGAALVGGREALDAAVRRAVFGAREEGRNRVCASAVHP